MSADTLDPVCSLPFSPTRFSLSLTGFPKTVRLTSMMRVTVRTPAVFLRLVWPLPLSLATTRRISVDFSSSRYLDVSVPGVPRINLWIQFMLHGSSPWVFPHSEICGYNAYLQLPAAYRSLSRPSSAPDAKAFTLRSFSLELPISIRFSHELSEFLNFVQDFLSRNERLLHPSFLFESCGLPHAFHLSVKLYNPHIWKDKSDLSISLLHLSSSVRFYSNLSSIRLSMIARISACLHAPACWSVWMDSNHRPLGYQPSALTS